MSSDNTYVNIGEMALSNQEGDMLIAPNLGSCVGVAAYDPQTKVGALIHCLLPLSKSNPERAAREPYVFVDTGVVLMFNRLIEQGADRARLQIAVAGGSNINDANNVFEIGKKNYTILRKILWKNNFLIKAEHVGESCSRTFSLAIGSGEAWVKVNNEKIQLM
jgi:chemotaxis protein CheD